MILPRMSRPPWSALKDAAPEGHVQYTVYSEKTGDQVATVFGHAANVPLVTAAPDMLAALQACEQVLLELLRERGENGQLGASEAATAWRDARDAINLATWEPGCDQDVYTDEDREDELQ